MNDAVTGGFRCVDCHTVVPVGSEHFCGPDWEETTVTNTKGRTFINGVEFPAVPAGSPTALPAMTPVSAAPTPTGMTPPGALELALRKSERAARRSGQAWGVEHVLAVVREWLPRIVPAPTEAGTTPVWAILYEDASVRPEVFTGEGAEVAARRRFAEARVGWTCHLVAAVATEGRRLAVNEHPPATRAVDVRLPLLDLMAHPNVPGGKLRDVKMAFERYVTEVEQQIAALAEDAARLDWLEAQGACMASRSEQDDLADAPWSVFKDDHRGLMGEGKTVGCGWLLSTRRGRRAEGKT